MAGPYGTPYELFRTNLLNKFQLLGCPAFEHAFQIIDPPTGNFPSLQQIANLLQSEVGKHRIKHFIKLFPVLNPKLICFELRLALYLKSFKKIQVLIGSSHTNDNGKRFGVIQSIRYDVGVMIAHPLRVDTSIQIVRTLVDQSRDCTFIQ